jgi:hypothetical protein
VAVARARPRWSLGETFAELAAGFAVGTTTANRARAQLRSPGERANARLKSWRILRKLRCCPWRAGPLAKAIHLLQVRETGG